MATTVFNKPISNQLQDLFIVEWVTLVDNVELARCNSPSGNYNESRYVYSETRTDLLKEGYTIAGALGIRYRNATTSGHDYGFAVNQAFRIQSTGDVYVNTFSVHSGNTIKIRIMMCILYIKNIAL